MSKKKTEKKLQSISITKAGMVALFSFETESLLEIMFLYKFTIAPNALVNIIAGVGFKLIF